MAVVHDSKICERLKTNSGDVLVNAIGTKEEVLAHSHGDIRDPLLWSCYRM